MLTAHLGALEFLPDSGKPFSIRDWISKKDGAKDSGSFLFLTSRGDQHASLRGLISTWLEIAVNALLSLEQDGGRRVWVILDELPTLHQVPSLQPGLAESRQFGGCFVLGIQVSSALRDLYGKNGAETISGLCGTRVVLAAPDRDTAQWSADSLGGAEVEEISEAFSYGANTIRDGVSLTPKRELRSLALPSEIMRLPNLTGYLKLPGPFPVAEIKLKYVQRPKAAERFEPRGDVPAASKRDADVQAPKADAESQQEADDETASPASAGTAGNQGELRLPLVVDAGKAGVTETVGKETLKVPAPARETEKTDLPGRGPGRGPGREEHLSPGEPENSEDGGHSRDRNAAGASGKPSGPATESSGSVPAGKDVSHRQVVPPDGTPEDGYSRDRLTSI